MSANTSASDLTTGGVTSPAVNEHVYAPVDDKRMLDPAAFEERRSMQPIGTERMNKKPRTTGGLVTGTHGTPSFAFMPPTNIMPPWAASSLPKCLYYHIGFLSTFVLPWIMTYAHELYSPYEMP